jgi:hypothetical protein
MNDFQDFLKSSEQVPHVLLTETRLDALLSFKKTSILGKFLALQFVGALFSLSLCPQFGLGLIDGHGVTHYFRMIGDWACAVFCASVFISSGSLLCLVTMKADELWWIWRNFKYSLILIPPALWMALMLSGWNLRFESEAISYHLVWMITGAALMLVWGQYNARKVRDRITRNLASA